MHPISDGGDLFFGTLQNSSRESVAVLSRLTRRKYEIVHRVISVLTDCHVSPWLVARNYDHSTRFGLHWEKKEHVRTSLQMSAHNISRAVKTEQFHAGNR